MSRTIGLMFKIQRSRSPGRLLLRPEVYHIYRTGRRTNVKIGTPMEHLLSTVTACVVCGLRSGVLHAVGWIPYRPHLAARLLVDLWRRQRRQWPAEDEHKPKARKLVCWSRNYTHSDVGRRRRRGNKTRAQTRSCLVTWAEMSQLLNVCV